MRDWRSWFKKAGIRAIKTMAQTAIASIGVAAVMSEVDWLYVLSASGVAGILSILTSIAGIPEEDVLDDYEIVDRLGEDEADDI